MELLASQLEADGPQLSYCHGDDDAQFVPETYEQDTSNLKRFHGQGLAWSV